MNNLISNLPAFPNLDQLGSTPASGASEGEGNFGSVLEKRHQPGGRNPRKRSSTGHGPA